MHIARPMLLLMSGATSGFAFVLSCGDNLGVKTTVDAASADAAMDAPEAPDAARICDCPAAEPPLAGRLELSLGPMGVDGGGAHGTTIALCPPGARAISGSCTVDTATYGYDKKVVLKESGFNATATGWLCSFRNDEPTQLVFYVMVMCLKPAP